MAFSYEDICRDIFAGLCRKGEVDFLPTRIGSYWNNDYGTDVPVHFGLKETVAEAVEIPRAFPGYEAICGIFSKSGFTPGLSELARGNTGLIPADEMRLL